MNQKIIVYISLLFMAASFVSFRWPLTGGTVTSTYGESRWDHFHDGMDMISADGAVFPVDAGSLVFYWDKAIFPLDNYPGGGNYKILEHRNGIYSIYMHLENGLTAKKKYAPGELLGIMGNTGHSVQRHLHFNLLEPAKRRSMNPLIVLPPLKDTSAPVISDIAFHIGDALIIVRDRSNIRLTRHYPLLVKITDSMEGRQNLGIYRLEAAFNGKTVLMKEFSGISFAGGRLTVGGKGFDELFDGKGYYKLEGMTYVEGENILKVTASDFAGNQAGREYFFNVKLDMNNE